MYISLHMQVKHIIGGRSTHQYHIGYHELQMVKSTN